MRGDTAIVAYTRSAVPPSIHNPTTEGPMLFVYLLMALIGVAATVFAVQNTADVAVHFLAWSTTRLPLAFVILLSAFVGIVFASTSAFSTQSRQRRTIRQLESQVAQLLEARRADAEAARLLQNRLADAEAARLRATPP